ncbi:sialidase family protein [Parvularcula dongshanensis]|uniref:Photosystem II stability/assembly factor-like uncharacterized protein n=1 Tax=Parvularcula dongshanensis TaxID=1173995 RepID=A0A840I004_9PROT|nr:sialidase family protein [Parvularcula dongshanensis]MBB4657603.1 photosystem II stability/assembly factor-like uncharacterized protein [Parvularcula dongshanensis]
MSLELNRRQFGLAAVAAALATRLSGDSAAETGAPYAWRSVKVGGGGFIPGIVFSTAERGLAYARSDMGGAYRWDASAQTWWPLQDDTPISSYFGVESIAPDPNNPDVVHAAVGMGSRGEAAMLRSDDRGETWRTTTVPFKMGGNEDGRGLGERLAVDPHAPDILYFASRHDGLRRSVDGGATWSGVKSFPHKGLGVPEKDTHGGLSFVAFDAGSARVGGATTRLYVGVADPGGPRLYRSDDAGENWTAMDGPDERFSAAQGAVDPRGVLFVTYSLGIGPNGVSDGAVWRYEGEEAQDVTPPRPMGGFMGLGVDRQNTGTVMVASMNRWQPGDTVWRSTDDGRSWTSLRESAARDVSSVPFLYWGNPEPEFGWWIAALAIDPFDPGHVAYATGATIYATDDVTMVDRGEGTQWYPWVEGIEQTAVITLTSLPEGPFPLLTGFGDISGFSHEDLTVSPSLQFTTPVFANTNQIEFAGGAPNVVVRSGTPHEGVGSEGHDGSTLAFSEDYGRSWHPLGRPEPDAVPVPADHSRMDLYRDAAVIVSADGENIMALTPTPRLTRDRGRSWAEVRGLPTKARPVADRVNGQAFYALDFDTGDWFVSQDHGATFRQETSRGLPNLADERPVWREEPFPLHAVPGREGDLWMVTRQGLYRSRDAGKRWDRVGGELSVERLSFGATAEGAAYPSLFCIGRRGDLRGIFRSDDEAGSWLRINDDRHEYARRYRTIAADPRVFGRVYLATDGRGVLYGEPT